MTAAPRLDSGHWLYAIDPQRLNPHERERLIWLAIQSLEAEAFRKRDLMEKPDQVKTWLRLRFGRRQDETFGMLFLDAKHNLIERSDLFRGTVDGCAVHLRVLVRRALEVNAAAAIAYHNHPSGDPQPSRQDRTITDKIRQALALIDVRLLDHIVVASKGAVSMAEQGLL